MNQVVIGLGLHNSFISKAASCIQACDILDKILPIKRFEPLTNTGIKSINRI